MDGDLARRLAYVEDRFAIQDLRSKYWLSIVEKDLETILSCYTDDAHSEFGYGFVVDGDQFRPFYAKLFGNENLIVQVPYGQNGLIELDDDAHAHGSWLLQVVAIEKGKAYGVRNGVRYNEKYRKVAGRWKIAEQRLDYLFIEEMKLRDGQ